MNNDLNALLAVLGVNGDDIVTVCYRPVGGKFKATVGTAADAQARAEQRKGSADVWFGVNPFAKRQSAGRGTAADVSRLTSLYADLDVKDNGLADMDMVRAVLLDVERILGSLRRRRWSRATACIRTGPSATGSTSNEPR